MNEFFKFDQDGDDLWPQYEAECQGCDTWGPVDDIGLCEDCAGKLERDMIRQRDWACSALAFGCPKDKLEDLRNEVINKYGEQLELIAEEKPTRNRSKKKRRGTRRSNRKKR
ncbi:MAG: hypothetical protein JSV84_15435 [Gemmatimonadota bacterium]|nr:MAG: hypothetical protein JSV84_15435 [Gemmatimonadota bacterium]